jgi:hypothetical protein
VPHYSFECQLHLVVNKYFIVSASFAALGLYVFVLFRWWHRRLVNLASQFNVPERRRRASRFFFVIVLLFYIPETAVVLASVARTKDGFFIVACLFMSLLPAGIWYARKIPALRTLGYYGGPPRT